MLTRQKETSRRELFDRYWQTRDYASADARTRQRTAYCARMMRNKSGRLLDVGCGRGYTSVYFAEHGYDVLGIDVSPQSVEWTAERGIEARVVDVENDPLDGEFAVIICLETLQYLHDPVTVLGKLKNALATGGELLLSLPNEYHVARRLSRLRGAPPEHNFVRTVCRPAQHRHLIENAGLTATAIRPISIVPPRWGILTGPGQLLARTAPSLFALSVIYRLVEK